MVRGNHDKVACGLEQPDGFNTVAKRAAHWTHDVLTPANRQWLAALPQGPVVVDDLVEICHGSPFDEDAYIFDELDAVRALKTSRRPLCLFGHTHWPVIFELADGRVDTIGSPDSFAGHVALRPESKYLVNPGSVGQPRDGDPRAAYGLVDTSAKSVDLYRVDYPIETTQAKVIKGGTARGAGAAAGGGQVRATCPSALPAFPAFRRRPLAAFALLSRRRSSAAYASRAAREPRIQPITSPTKSTDGMKMK